MYLVTDFASSLLSAMGLAASNMNNRNNNNNNNTTQSTTNTTTADTNSATTPPSDSNRNQEGQFPRSRIALSPIGRRRVVIRHAPG